MNKIKIVVAGDVCIDWLAYPWPAKSAETGGPTPLNWQLDEGTRMIAKRGGALLLSRLVGEATGAKVVTHMLAADIEVIPPEEVLHSLAELKRVPRSPATSDEPKV